MKKFRIFYAPQVYRTWEKIFILTDDGTLYCEYLMRFRNQTIVKKGIDYESFRPNDYSWGKGVQGDRGMAFENYQQCEVELSWTDYENLKPSDLLENYNAFGAQVKWLDSYLTRNGLSALNHDNSYISNK